MMFARFGAAGASQSLQRASKHISLSTAQEAAWTSSTGGGRHKSFCSIGEQRTAEGRLHVCGGEHSSSTVQDHKCTSPAQQKNELHLRLAGLWGMPSELLFERQQTIATLLGPSGCGTTAHALWLLVRSPQLRHTNEQVLRNNLRQLHRLVSHTEVDRAALLTAVYKYPWILEAMHNSTPPPAAAGASTAAHEGVSTHAADHHQQQQQQQAPQPTVPPATWRQELAAVVLELQQADYQEHLARSSNDTSSTDAASSSRGLSMSPRFASAAVRTYLAFGEVKQRVANTAMALADRLLLRAAVAPHPAAAEGAASPPPASSSSSSSSAPAPASTGAPSPSPCNSGGDCGGAHASSPQQHQQQQQWPSTEGHHHLQPREDHDDDALPGSSSSSSRSAVDEVMTQLQQQHQQHLLLQQLLASCPHLVVLPPELLLARWARLLSVVQGCSAEATATSLVVHSPYLLVSYNDDATARMEAQIMRQSYA